MRKRTKAWLFTASMLILAGGILFAYALGSCGWDFSNLSTTQLESITYEITEPFHNISINTVTADVVFMSSDNDMCKVECYESPTGKHTVEVREDALTVVTAEKMHWEDFISISTHKSKITIYLPQKEYENLTVRLTTGDVTVQHTAQEDVMVNITTGKILMEDVVAESMDVSVTTGSITLEDILCTGDISTRTTTGKVHLTGVRGNNLHSQGSTGDILLNDVVASESLSLTRTSGDIELEACDAPELLLKVTTGDITGTLLTDKVFITHTTTGTVDVPGTVTGGKCEIHTTTGDIHIAIP